MTQLRGSSVLVTGATGGLGRDIARRLRDEGASVIVTGRQPSLLQSVADEVGGRAIVADLSQRSDLSRLLDEAGPIDIAVMNAALPGSGDLAGWSPSEIDRAVEVNLSNPMAMTRALLPAFLERRSGHFVFISSLSGKVASSGASIYSATKFGLRGFALALRCELYGTGIGSSVICPGFVREAGMFADAGIKLPTGMSTVSPAQVSSAVVKAIAKNKAEIDVAPLSLRLGALIGSVAPGISTVAQARFGAGVADQMKDAQKHKRV